MKTTNEKRIFQAPQIEKVELDNEISLVLQSAPPMGPDEVNSFQHEHSNPDPFKTNIG